MKSYSHFVFVTLAILLVAPHSTGQRTSRGYPCFNALSVGQVKVDAPECQESDPLKLGQNELVQAMMNGFGIDPVMIAFHGCKSTNFRVMESEDSKGMVRFVINYPLSIGNRFLAPVSHELAHVVQILKAGNSQKLKESSSSIEIELAADFMVGYSFARHLKSVSFDQFLENLSLVGLYVEKDIDAHGTPEQRSNAFRIGAVNAYPFSQLSLSKSIDHFLRNNINAILNQ